MAVMDIVALLWLRKLRLIGASLLGAAVAIGASFLVEPLYEARSTLVPNDTNADALGGAKLFRGLEDLAGLAGVSLNSGTGNKEAMAFLKSRDFMTRFVASQNLVPLLLPDLKERTQEARLKKGYLKFRRILSVNEDLRSGLVQVSLRWNDPAVAAKLTNAYVSAANEELRLRDVTEAQRAIDHLTNEIEKTQVLGLRQTMFGLMEKEIRTVTLANVRHDYAFRVVDPAIAPDPSERVRPRRGVMGAFGFLVGGLISFLLGVLRPSKMADASKGASSETASWV